MSKEKLIIMGSGPAGCTAAIYTARAGLSPVIYAGMMPGGLLTQTTTIENFPGFPEGVQGFDLVTSMQAQAEHFGARIEFDVVEQCELSDGGLQKVALSSGETVEANALIIATGAVPRSLGLPAEERLRGRGVSACAVCDGAFFKELPVVVVGGGDSAMEEAIYLTRFASCVYVIHRRKELRASPIMAERARSNSKIKFIWSSVVEDILGEKSVEGVRIRDLESESTSELACRGFFVALGHVPDTKLFQGKLQLDPQGFIVLDGATSKTSLQGVFAAGDCADPRYRQAIVASGMGCRAGMDAERYLEGK